MKELSKDMNTKRSFESVGPKETKENILHHVKQKQDEFEKKHENVIQNMRREISVLTEMLGSVNLEIASLKFSRQGTQQSSTSQLLHVQKELSGFQPLKPSQPTPPDPFPFYTSQTYSSVRSGRKQR